MADQAPLIAIIDDEESVRRAFLRLLRSANYRAEAFVSATDFLDALSLRTPDCIILDLQMPMMTGFELQERLARLGRHPPVIVITAHDEVETRDRCLALGASGYFRKPVEADDLIEAINTILDCRADP
jgi:FixJ family two-component response regulator